MTTDRPFAYLTRRATFSAAHRLWSDHLSPEDNAALFGDCARRHGHGHNYTIEVTIRGEIEPTTGVVVNLTTIRDAIRELVINEVDLRHLNLDATPCAGLNPTAELRLGRKCSASPLGPTATQAAPGGYSCSGNTALRIASTYGGPDPTVGRTQPLLLA